MAASCHSVPSVKARNFFNLNCVEWSPESNGTPFELFWWILRELELFRITMSSYVDLWQSNHKGIVVICELCYELVNKVLYLHALFLRMRYEERGKEMKVTLFQQHFKITEQLLEIVLVWYWKFCSFLFHFQYSLIVQKKRNWSIYQCLSMGNVPYLLVPVCY